MRFLIGLAISLAMVMAIGVPLVMYVHKPLWAHVAREIAKVL